MQGCQALSLGELPAESLGYLLRFSEYLLAPLLNQGVVLCGVLGYGLMELAVG